MRQFPGHFPRLNLANHRIVSPLDEAYNCIAWVMRDTSRWWDADPLGLYYWPPDIPRIQTLDTYISLFERSGYTRCGDAALEAGFEKVAIYALENGEFTHVARQLDTGEWTSKLGDWEDIQHSTLDVLECPSYGHVVCILRRPTPSMTV